MTDSEGTPDAKSTDAYTGPDSDVGPSRDDEGHEIDSSGDRDAGPVDAGESRRAFGKPRRTVRESRRTVLGYAFLFSLPVGAGVAVMLLQVTRRSPSDALVFGPSLAIATAVFLLLLVIGSGGSPEP